MALRQQDAATEGMQHQIIVAGAVGMSIAAFTTVLRLALRARKLWWDDALAFAGLVFLLTTGVAGKIYYSINDTSNIPQNSRVALYYIFAVTFDLTIWISRLSVILNLIRLGYYKRRLCSAAVLFIVALVILVAQIFWVCEPQNRQTGWKSATIPQCVLGKNVAIAQVTTDIFADTVLVAVPLMLLRDLNASDTMAHRVRLTASFAIAGLTTVVSIVHAYYLWQDTQVSVIVSNVELSVSVIVCNFVVLSAAAHRLWDRYYTRKMRLAHRSTHMDFESPTTTATQVVGAGRNARLDPSLEVSMDEVDFDYRILDAAYSHYEHPDVDRVEGRDASFTADKLHSKNISMSA